MTTFDELFGSTSNESVDYLKWTNGNEGESYVLEVTGKAGKTHHQLDFATKKPKYFVQSEAFGLKDDGTPKWKVLKEGEFDPSEVKKANPILEIEVPTRVLKYKNPKGEENPDFVPFNLNWVPNKDQEEKLKEAMLDSQLSLTVGTLIGIKFLRLGDDGKERKFKIGLKAGE